MIRSLTTQGERVHRRGSRRTARLAVGALALGTLLGVGARPVDALPSMSAVSVVGLSAASPVNESMVARDLDSAGCLTVLGEQYVEQRALADAEAAFHGALAIVEAAVGPTDPRLADSVTALADVRYERRDFGGAETLYPRALAIIETAYGSEDPRIAGPLANLAGLYRTWGRWDDATPLYLRLVGVFERVLGADDFHVALTLNNVAEIYATQARYAEAEALYGRVLAILEPWLGSEHPLVQQLRAEHARARHQLERGGEKQG